MKHAFSFKKPLIWILIAALVVSAVAVAFVFKKKPVTEVSEALDACIVSAIRD